jgi:tRNA-splicing ligase RtcB (3'-phosphate/5'-hydroxy nucleic acid ligase)
MSIQIKGKYNTAIVYNDDLEEGIVSQIVQIVNHPATKDSHIRIMPDVHVGAGICIGFTAKLTDKVVPNWIGVDIGCGVLSYKIGDIKKLDFNKIDNFIRRAIPFGMNIRRHKYKNIDEIVNKLYNDKLIETNYKTYTKRLSEVCKKINESLDRTFYAMGSLGGGNHFIEINKDNNEEYWLTIHSGSRHFGLSVAKFHQKKAQKYINKRTKDCSFEINRLYHGKNNKTANDLDYIKKYEEELNTLGKINKSSAFLPMNEGGNAYLSDMRVAQEFALINRRIMAKLIIEDCLGFKNLWDLEEIESVHNYINFKDKIIRKGAISAYKDEKVIIPLNMRDGTIIGIGESNEDWNFSAPHGAGRVYSRRQAKKSLSLDQYRKEMEGIWTSCVKHSTLDESPMAYKSSQEIINYVKATVDIKTIMKPVYNFKAEE